jgi:hypothetical protein
LTACLKGSTASAKRPASMAAPARALSDSAVSAGGVFTAGAVFAGGFAFDGAVVFGDAAAFGDAAVFDEDAVFDGAGFVLARRGAVRCGAARSRVAVSLLRFGSTKTPALPVRSPSCARADGAPAARRDAASRHAPRNTTLKRFTLSACLPDLK